VGSKKKSKAVAASEPSEPPEASGDWESLVASRPRTPEQLHAWVAGTLGVQVPREGVIDGHCGPFAYLEWVYFGSVTDRLPAPPPPAAHPIPGVPDAVVWASRGGGKTFLGAVATTIDLVFHPGIEVRILAGSLEQAQRMHAHLRGFFQREPLAPLVAGRVTEKRLRLVNGSTVELLAQSQTAVRGTRVQRLRCDEVELFDPAVWDAAQLTTRSKQCGDRFVRGSVECLSTMHVPHGLMHRMIAEAREGKRRLFKWGVVDVLERCGEDRACGVEACEHGSGTHDQDETPTTGHARVTLPVLDVPSKPTACKLWDECQGRAKARARNDSGEGVGHVGIDDAIRMKGRVSRAVWEAEMLCLRPRRDDTVLPEFDPKVHVVAQAPTEEEGAMWVGGMDFGYRSPAVVLWGVLDAGRRLWIVDERIRKGQTTSEHSAAIHKAAWPKLAWLGVDPAGNAVSEQTGKSPASVLRELGHVIRSGRCPVARGLEMVRARLRPASEEGGPRLFVHQRCAGLIESLERYHYPENDPESMEPVKDGFDHAVDALRYLVQNLDMPRGATMRRYV
jgi:hypothetical protein